MDPVSPSVPSNPPADEPAVPTARSPESVAERAVQYEFNESQNAVIRDLSQKMFFASIVFLTMGITLGGLKLVIFINDTIPTWQVLLSSSQPRLVSFTLLRDIPAFIFGFVVQTILPILFGFWLKQSASSFQSVVSTQGHDIDSMMEALRELKRLFVTMYWFVLGTLSGFILLNLAGMIFGIPQNWDLLRQFLA